MSPETRLQVERRYRRFFNYRSNLSKQTVLIERRIASEMTKVRRNLLYPPQTFRRQEKLLPSNIKKILRIPPPKTSRNLEKITSVNRESFNGRVKEGGSIDEGGSQKSIVPFYFDHFLSINGYQPNYNFKSQIELRDGAEVDRFQIKSLLPDVLEKFEKCQLKKKKIADEHISKNSKMYHNVQM